MDDKPMFRVGAAGLEQRDLRLIEIVFRHSRYNKYEYQLVPAPFDGQVDVLIANSADREAMHAAAGVRRGDRGVPVIAVVPRGGSSAARHAISIERLTLQLLPILNRVVDLDLAAAPPAAATPSATPAPAPATLAPAPAPVALAPVPAPAPAPAPEPAPATPAPAGVGERSSPNAVAESPAKPDGGAAPAKPPVPTAAEVPGGTSAESAGPAHGTPAQPSGSLPASPAPQAPDSQANLLRFPSQGAAEPSPARTLRVLVVDDSPTVRHQLSIAFDRLGLECETVASAADALRRLGEAHFDLALVDVVMPEVDGYRLTREIRRNRQWKQMPVIILTSRSSPFDLARGALAGCDTYLTKPVPFRALEEAVTRLLRKSLAIDDLGGLVRSPEAAAPVPGTASAPTAARSPLARLEAGVARLFGRG